MNFEMLWGSLQAAEAQHESADRRNIVIAVIEPCCKRFELDPAQPSRLRHRTARPGSQRPLRLAAMPVANRHHDDRHQTGNARQRATI